MPGEVSRSYEGPSDEPPQFPPRWAMEHLSDEEYTKASTAFYVEQERQRALEADDFGDSGYDEPFYDDCEDNCENCGLHYDSCTCAHFRKDGVDQPR